MPAFKTHNIEKRIQGSFFPGLQFEIEVDGFVLTGCTIKMEMKLSLGSPAAKTFSTTDGTITIDSTTEFTLVGCNMDIAPGDYLYDIKITDTDNDNHVWVKGVWPIEAKVTN